MIENPRPTRHLEHIEPARVGTPIPGSAQARAAASAGDLMTPDGLPADGEPGSTSADGVGAGLVPDQARSRLRVVVAGGVTLAVVALGICGALVLGGDHPDDVGVAASVAGVPDLPAVALHDQPSDRAGGTERLTEARTRLADAVEDGETTHVQAAARSATPPAALRSLRRALDAGRAALEVRPPNDGASEARTVAYLKTLDTRRSAILDAVKDVADAGHAQPGPAAPWSTPGRGSGGTAPVGPAPDQGGASEGATGGSGGGRATGGGSEGDTTDSTGSTGGGTTTPPATAPPPSADPTSEPSTEPPLEPTPGPTPDSSASPTAAPESAGP